LVGTALSALGLGLIVFGVLRRRGKWGFVQPKPDAAPNGSVLVAVANLADARRRDRASCCSSDGEEPTARAGAPTRSSTPKILR